MCSYDPIDADAGFDWNAANIQHIARHRVEPEDAEEAFTGEHLIVRSWNGRYVLLGRSEAGRYLSIAYILRNGLIRVITARSMNHAERRRFRRS